MEDFVDIFSDDFLIERYDWEINILNDFIKAGFNKGEVCLMFELLGESGDNEPAQIKLRELYKKFSKTKNKKVKHFLSFIEDLDE